jgi:aryl-alcohol dehydrogenase
MRTGLLEIKAAVLRAVDTPFSIETSTMDSPGPEQIAVRISGSGLSHTDIFPRVHPAIALPLVPGHEGSGVVESVGERVDGVAAGDHVVLSFDFCGHCRNCLNAQPAYCRSFFPRNVSGSGTRGASNARDQNGDAVSSRWFGQSSFAEIAIVDARNAVVVSK